MNGFLKALCLTWLEVSLCRVKIARSFYGKLTMVRAVAVHHLLLLMYVAGAWMVEAGAVRWKNPIRQKQQPERISRQIL